MADEPEKFILGDTAIAASEESGKRRFFRRRKNLKPPLLHCENCGAQLTGHWCSHCGQQAIDYRRSFRHVVVDLLDSFINWDSKFFKTIGLLLTRPWRLTNEFLGGRRVRYLHPARLYLLASILFFFAVSYWAKSIKIDPVNLSPEQRSEIKDELKREDLPPEARAKIEKALKLEDPTPEPAAQTEQGPSPPPPPKEEPKTFLELGTDSKAPANEFEKWIETRAKEKFGERGTKFQLFIITLINNLPYMMLACIPLFAVVLKILYIRRRIFYIDHLVYALHIHTFAYLAVMLIILATMGLNRTLPGLAAGWIILLLWMIFAVQIFLSIRRVYRQGWLFSILKFFVGGLAYLMVLLVALAATFFITVVLPS